MKKITDKEYKEWQKYKKDCLYGRVLTPEGLRITIEAENFDAEKIGRFFLEMYPKIKEWTDEKYK